MINCTNKRRRLIKELFETNSDDEYETDSLEDFSKMTKKIQKKEPHDAQIKNEIISRVTRN
jgi:hypothetical protein